MKILLVEDKVGGILGRILQKWGHEVLLADDAENAWKLLTENEIDLFLVDWVLPGMSGLELVKKIRHLPSYLDTPLIMISSRNRREDFKQVLEAGVDGYLTKPFTPVQLKSKIQDIRHRTEAILDSQTHEIIKRQRAFDQRSNDPLILVGFGASTEDGVRTTGQVNVRCMRQLIAAIDALNEENPSPRLSFFLVESTTEIAQLLSHWTMRKRTVMVVIFPSCKGNTMLLLRLLGRRNMATIPFVLLCDGCEDELPQEVADALNQGAVQMLTCGGILQEEWTQIIRRQVTR